MSESGAELSWFERLRKRLLDGINILGSDGLLPVGVANAFQVGMRQIEDPGNSAVITSASPFGNAPGNPFTGVQFSTTTRDIQECISVLTAFDASGDPIPDLTFIFTFRGLPEGIHVRKTIKAFSSTRLLHTTDWLSNLWTNYQVEVEPSRPLVAGETIVIATRHSKQSGNKFLFPLDYDFQEDEQAAPVVQSFNKGIQPDLDVVSEKADGTVFTYSTPDDDPLTAGQLLQPPHEPHGAFGIDTDGFRSAEVLYESDVPTADNGILVEITPDFGAVPQKWLTFQRYTYRQEDVGAARVFRFSVVGDGMRVSVLNNPTVGQGEVTFQFNLHAHAVQNPTGSFSQQLTQANLALMTQGKLIAPDVDGVFGDVARDGGANGSGLNTVVTSIEDDISIRPLNSAVTSQVVCGSLSAARLDLSPLTDRREVIISNMEVDTLDGTTFTPGNAAVFGHDSGLTENNGFDLPAGRAVSLLLDASVPIYVRAKTGSGGTENTQNLTGTTNSGTAANTANAKASVPSGDATYSNVTATGQTINIGGFSITPTPGKYIQSMILKGIIKKQAGQFQTAAIESVTVGTAGNVGSVSTSAPVPAGTRRCYQASIARSSTTTVTGVSGLPGVTFTYKESKPSDDSNRVLDIWIATGTPTSSGIVTATFLAAAVQSMIQVVEMSGVDQSTPVEDFDFNAINSSAVSVPALNCTNKGMAVLVTACNNRTSTPSAGYTEQYDNTVGSGGTQIAVAIDTKPITSTGTETPTATLSGGNHYIAIGLTYLPAPAIDPTGTLSYTLSGVPGATTEVVTVSSTSNTLFTLDITADKTAWAYADIPNLNVIFTGGTFGNAGADVDVLFPSVVETDGPTCRISLHQGARPNG